MTYAPSTYLLKLFPQFLFLNVFFSFSINSFCLLSFDVFTPMSIYSFVLYDSIFYLYLCSVFLCITLFFPVEDPHYNARGVLILYVRGRGCYFLSVFYLFIMGPLCLVSDEPFISFFIMGSLCLVSHWSLCLISNWLGLGFTNLPLTLTYKACLRLWMWTVQR